jgi:serine/threonine-protein kinase
MAGGPVPLIETVFRLGGIYTPQYAVSDSGTLVYIQGTGGAIASASRTLVWVDRKGKAVPIAAAPNDYGYPRVSPDGTKVALAVYSVFKSDIWTLDLVREAMTRLTFNETSDAPLWTPDGKRIVFVSGYSGKYAVYWKAADGSGEDERLSSEQLNPAPWSWSKDGKTLLLMDYTESRGTRPYIGALSMEGDHNRRPLLQEKYSESEPIISPDGRWMAYTSEESGKSEVYVRPFPDVNKGKWQVSTSGGDAPLWSPDGRELFYRNGDSVMAAAVQTETTFKPGKTEALFQGKYASSSWDINPDGKRFLMMKEATSSGKPAAAETPRKINIVVNWTEELKQRVPGK